MATRRNAVDEAARRARRQVSDLIRDLRGARLMAGMSQGTLARGLGRSRELVTGWENGRSLPDLVDMARWAAALGLEIPFRAFTAGSPLRDAGQLRTLARARSRIGPGWSWRTEVPVSDDPHDRRAVDAVISRRGGRVGLEAITRLTDAQAQTRNAQLKQEAARLDCMILVLADTRHNRQALRDAAPTLEPSFPLRSREVLRALRAGHIPGANGVLLV